MTLVKIHNNTIANYEKAEQTGCDEKKIEILNRKNLQPSFKMNYLILVLRWRFFDLIDMIPNDLIDDLLLIENIGKRFEYHLSI